MTKEIDWEKPPRAGYVFVDVVDGVEGPCLTIGDHGSATRVAGPKPWGGGNTVYRFEVKASELREELDSPHRQTSGVCEMTDTERVSDDGDIDCPTCGQGHTGPSARNLRAHLRASRGEAWLAEIRERVEGYPSSTPVTDAIEDRRALLRHADSLHSRLIAAEQENAQLKQREACAAELLARAEAAERLREAVEETCDYLSTLVPSAASDDMATALTAVVIDLRAALAAGNAGKAKDQA